jgi:ADP-heptose:LPS heptosyltransferase
MRPQITVLAPYHHNLSEKFAPLIDEIRRHRPGAIIVGVFLLPSDESDPTLQSTMFEEVHFVPYTDEGVKWVQRQAGGGELLVFIHHVTTIMDCRLNRIATAFPSNYRPRYICCNRLSLDKYFRTSMDDSRMFALRMMKAYLIHVVINAKVLFFSYFTASALLASKAVQSLVPVQRHRKKRILFIKLDVMGDMIITLPYIHALRRTYPDAELTVLASSRGAGILREQHRLHSGGLYDRLQVWDTPWHFRLHKILGIGDLFDIIAHLPYHWRQHYDVAIQPVNFGTGIAVAALTLARKVTAVIDRSLPLSRRMRSLIDDPVDVRQNRIYHLKDTTELLLAHIGVVKDERDPRLLVDSIALASVQELLKREGHSPGKKLLLFNVGAGNPLRVWGNDKFAKLIQEISARYDSTCVLIGSQQERTMADDICRKAQLPVINTAGILSLNELIALCSVADLLVTVDTGTMHLAAALDTPIVAIFGAGLVESCLPLSKHYVIVKEELGCSGCGDRCFIDGYPPCLDRVTVPRVFAAVQQMLSERASDHGN